MQVILWFVDDCRMFAPFPSGGGVAHIIPEGDVFFWGHSGDQGGGTSMGKLCHHFPTFPFESGDVFSSLCLQLCWNGTSPRFGSAKMVGTVGSTPSPYCEFMRGFPAIGALNCTLSPCFIVWNKGKNHLEAAADSSYTKVVRSTDH